jgi:hypothetical protein
VELTLDLPVIQKARPKPPRYIALVTVDGHTLGRIESMDAITPAMRSHGVSTSDIDLVVRGRVRARRFRCNGSVVIVGELRVAPSKRAKAA